jgi:hypothetical protein
MLVVGRVLAKNPTTDALLCWRSLEVLRLGVLEGQGDQNRAGLPREVRKGP